MLNNLQSGLVGTDAQARAPLPTERGGKRKAAFLVFGDQISREERPISSETATVTHQTSKQLLVCNTVAGIPVNVDNASTNLVPETITTSQRGTERRVSTVLETLVLNTFRKIVSSSEFMCQFPKVVIGNPWFITPVVALIRSE